MSAEIEEFEQVERVPAFMCTGIDVPYVPASEFDALLSLARKQAEENQAMRDALVLIFDKWENGTPCRESDEDGDCSEGSDLGHAFRLSFEEESAIIKLLNPTQYGGNAVKAGVCLYCVRDIAKVRAPQRIGGRVWRWATVEGNRFYCPRAVDCWHVPAPSERKELEG